RSRTLSVAETSRTPLAPRRWNGANRGGTGHLRGKGGCREFATDLIQLLAIIGGMLLAAAWFQVSVGLRPLATVRSRLSAIRSGESRRLGSQFPSEIRPMALEIDELLDARDQELSRARTRAADLAHGLRTLFTGHSCADRTASRPWS